jgi:L-amino acid N-acyltransferase YncA
MEVRPAEVHDVPAILEIYNDAILTTTATYDLEPVSLEVRRAWFDEHVRQNLPVLVAIAGDDVAGFASLSLFREKPGYRFTVENSVYVAPAHRGKGVGARLLEAIVAEARHGGFHAVIAGVDAENETSIRLHARCGFVEVGRLKQVGFKFDRWLDVVYMEKIL